MRDLCEVPFPAALAHDADGEPIGLLSTILANTPRDKRDTKQPWLLAPTDLQAIKAAGVTFAVSMLERVIEEKARGAPELAPALRREITALIGDDLSRLKPGSKEAVALKKLLIDKGMWSQYLEVGIGPDAEIFTKAPPMAAVGHLAEIGVRPDSSWNNPEPEIVIVASSTGNIVGATLGNDVNLRDFEGSSARPRTTTPVPRLVPSFVCSTATSRWMMSARPTSICRSTARTDTGSAAVAR
jgi:fumarylacetoacetate (FAA) hydrolase family protein